jgi:integrase
VPLTVTADLRAVLADHKPDEVDPEARVFTMPGGGPLDRHLVLRRYFRPAVKATLPARFQPRWVCGDCGAAATMDACSSCRSREVTRLSGLRFHDLRHTCASLLLDAKVPLFTVSRFLGHESINTTARHYGHLQPDWSDQLGSILDGEPSATVRDLAVGP